MIRSLLAVLLLCSLAAFAQKKSDQATLPPDAGALTGREYRSAFFGFTYERGLNWRWLEAEQLQQMRDEAAQKAQARLGAEAGALANQRTYFLAVAMAPMPGTAVLITAEDLLMEPGVPSAAQYLDTVIANSPEFMPQGAAEARPLGGVPFTRRYFTQKSGEQTVYHAMTATILRRFALSFDCVAASREQLDEALKTLDSVQFAEKKK